MLTNDYVWIVDKQTDLRVEDKFKKYKTTM